jgi:glyoxylate reductase
VCNFAVGVDNIDLAACRRRGVRVGNTPDAVTEGTANMAMALLLAVARRLVEADRFARTGAWQRRGPMGMAEFMGVDLCGKLLLIVGAGRIGYATAQRAQAFGMRIGYVARSRRTGFELAPLAARRYDLEDGLRVADVVSLHTPLTPETRHMIDARRLAMLRPEAILINTARGPIVDEAALVEHLRGGRMWGAGLDVFEREPALAPGLAELDNVVLTPHLGSAEARWRRLMATMVQENCEAILEGREPPHGV